MTAARGRGVVALAFGAMLAVAAVLLFAGTGESSGLAWRRGRPVPDALAPGVTVVDPAIPVEVAADTTAWTGAELLTFGARVGENVGAVYDASAGRWRAMSPVPFGALVRGAAGVWTGRLFVVVGVLCDQARGGRAGAGASCGRTELVSAAYEPDTDTWRVIDANPHPAADDFSTGHGGAFPTAVGMLGRDAVFLVDGQYYGFRPDSWDWEWLTPLAASGPTACSADRVLARLDDDHALTLARGSRVWVASAEPLPTNPPPPLASVCTPRALLVYPKQLDAPALYRIGSDRWEAVPPPPVAVAGVDATAAYTGSRVLFRVGPARAITYDLATRTWREAAPGLTVAPDTVAWTGDGYGLYVRGRRLNAYEPGV